jgi:hypothetical protein
MGKAKQERKLRVIRATGEQFFGSAAELKARAALVERAQRAGLELPRIEVARVGDIIRLTDHD